MARSDAFCEDGQFYCCQLASATPEDERDIMAFESVDPKGAGLVSYLQHFAFPDEDAGLMRTYLVRDKDIRGALGARLAKGAWRKLGP